MSECNLACGAECTKDTCPVFKAYQQGRADEKAKILGMVDVKQFNDFRTRSVDIRIRFEGMLNAEQVLSIILEQLKENKNE